MMTAQELKLEFVRCRTLGHAWDELPASSDPRIAQVFSWQDAFRCVRCGTRKYESYNMLGEVAQRYYEYPDGYKLAVKTTRAEFRLELRRRRKDGRLQRKKRA